MKAIPTIQGKQMSLDPEGQRWVFVGHAPDSTDVYIRMSRPSRNNKKRKVETSLRVSQEAFLAIMHLYHNPNNDDTWIMVMNKLPEGTNDETL